MFSEHVDSDEPIKVIDLTKLSTPSAAPLPTTPVFIHLVGFLCDREIGGLAHGGRNFPPPHIKSREIQFKFSEPHPLYAGQKYWVRLWETGKTRINQSFHFDDDVRVRAVTVRVWRPGLPAAKLWVTLDATALGLSSLAKSGAIMVGRG